MALMLFACAPSVKQGASEPVMVALAMIGTPYRFGGSELGGFDCSGLSRYVYAQSLGIDLPRTARAQSELPGSRLGRRQLVPGDLVFFETTGRGVSHVGIYAGEERFVHAPSAGGIVQIKSLGDAYWGPRFRFGKRPR
jgi:cell wall-associated NlpC family hydrolase